MVSIIIFYNINFSFIISFIILIFLSESFLLYNYNKNNYKITLYQNYL